MFEKLHSAVASKPKPRAKIITFGPWHGGIVTARQPEQFQKSECDALLNMVLIESGMGRTRDGCTLVSEGMTGSPVCIGRANVQGTWYTFGTDDDNHLYYDSSGTMLALATLEGETWFCEYQGYLILFDGGNLKYWDGTETLGSEAVTNGAFAADTNWTKGTAGWTIAAGKASCDGTQTAVSNLYQDCLTDDLPYKIQFTISSRTAGTLTLMCGSGAVGTARSTNATFTEYLFCTTDTKLYLQASADFVGSVDDVTAKPVVSVNMLYDDGIGTDYPVASWAVGTPYVVGTQAVNDSVAYRAKLNHRSSADTEPGLTTAENWKLYWESTPVSSNSPYQFNNRNGSDDTNEPLGDGTNSRVATKFTSTTWDTGTGYTNTIPPTTGYCVLKKEGTGGTGSVLAKLRLVSDDSILASKTIVSDVTAVVDDAEISWTYTSSDITTEMTSGVAYYLSLEFTNSHGTPATNHILVKSTTVASGGTSYAYAAATWGADTTKTLKMGLKPGAAPSGVFGTVHNQRLFFIEGASGSNPGHVWYSAAGNHLDFSTPDGGGYLTVGDATNTGWAVGAIASWYNTLYIFGTASRQYLAALSGESPASYSASISLQHVSAHYKSLVVTSDDVWFLLPSGPMSLKTVQEYGNIKVSPQGGNIKDKILLYYDTSAFAGYCPQWGLYLLKLNGYDNPYAFHTQLKSIKQQGAEQVIFSPASEFQYAVSGDITAFGQGDGYLLVADDTGAIFKMDPTVVKDNENDVTFELRTGVYPTIFGELQAWQVSTNYSAGKFGGVFEVHFYKDHNQTAFHDIEITLPRDTTILTTELTMATTEMGWMTSPEYYTDRRNINFNFRTLQVSFKNIELFGSPLYFGPVIFKCFDIGGH